jgi:hypothetical protein
VNYWTDPNQKTPSRAHLVTTREYFDVISLDWKSQIARIQCSEVEQLAPKGASIVLSLRSSVRYSTLILTTPSQRNPRGEPNSNLTNAFTAIQSVPSPGPHYRTENTTVLTSFGFSAPSQTTALKRAATEQTTQILTSIGASNPLPLTQLVDLFICVYRMRFRNEAGQAIDNSADACSVDLRRHIFVVWCSAVPKCLKQHDFYRSVLGSVLSSVTVMISTFANRLGIRADDIIQAPQAAAARIQRDAAEATDRGLGQVPPYDPQNLKFVLDLAAAVISGVAAGLWAADVKQLVGRIIEFTEAVIAEARVDDAKKEVVAAEGVFLRQLATLLDGRRWDEVYQFVFRVWDRRTAEA